MKINIIVLIFVAILSLTACKKETSQTELNASDSTQNLNTQAEAQPATQAIADGSSNDSSLKNQDKATVVKGDTVTTASGLRYIDIEKGKGKKVVVGMNLKIDYAGFFTDGKVFDTSIESVAKSQNFDRHGMAFTPFDVVIGKGSVIAGWDEGLTTNMNIGGKRRLLVPPNLAYGESGMGGVIPPNASLIFDVNVISGQ